MHARCGGGLAYPPRSLRPSACGGEHRPAQGPPAAAATTEPSTIVPAQPTATIAPAADVTITHAPGTVRRGARATVAARAAPGAQCSIVVRYKSGLSRAQGVKNGGTWVLSAF
jgi:hypothetical protein